MTTPDQLSSEIKKLRYRLRFILMVAVPFGAVTGFFFGGGICYAILRFQGGGQSHNDATAVASFAMLGMLAGALLFPVLAWIFLVGRKWK